MKRHLHSALAALALTLAALPLTTRAQTSAVPTFITYQGKVSDAAGNLIGSPSPVNRTVIFRIYDHATNTAAVNRLYSEQQTVTIANGEFNVLVGGGAVVGTEAKPAFDTLFTGASRFLGVTVDDGNAASTDPEISPRQQIVTMPYAFRAKVAEGLAASITATQIADTTITGAKLVADTVATLQLANLAVTTAKLADANVTTAKLADANITTAKLTDANVTLAKLAANSVDTSKIVDATIATADLAANAVTSAKILDGTIVTADLADNAVTSAKIVDATIATADLANNAVSTAKLADASITAAKLATDIGGTNGAYNYLRINGGNTSGYLFGAFNQIGDGIHLTYNNFNNNAGWSVAAPAGGQSRVSLGYGTITLATAPVGGVPAGGTSRMEVAADGRVGFSGANGDANVQVLVNNTSGRVYPFAIATSAGPWFYFEHNGNAYKSGGGSWASSSDLRLKTDVRALSGSLEKLLQLRSVHFLFKDQAKYASGLQTGFIAQEMERIFPEWVSTGADGMKAISFSGFESHTVQALRELRAEKDAQIAQRDATIAALDQRIRDLETQTTTRLAAIERRLNAASLSANSPR